MRRSFWHLTIESLRRRRPWWLVMFIGVFGCGGCCSGCGCAGRDHPVFHAAKKGDVDKVREYLDADPSLLTETYRQPARGRNFFSSDTGKQLVHWSAEEGKVEVLKLLKERGADLEKPVNDWSRHAQPIHLAAASNRPEAVAWFLDNGISIEAKTDANEMTPLYAAAESNASESVELLLARGANVEARYRSGGASWTALNAVSRNARDDKAVRVAKLLLEKGADVNARDSQTQATPLHDAAIRGSSPMIRILLDFKADVRAKTADGKTAIDFVPLHNAEAAELLIAAGAPREPWEIRKREAEKPPEAPPPQEKK